METFEEYLLAIENEGQRAQLKNVLEWITNRFPDLETRMAWNQPCSLTMVPLLLDSAYPNSIFRCCQKPRLIDKFAAEIEKPAIAMAPIFFESAGMMKSISHCSNASSVITEWIKQTAPPFGESDSSE